MGRGRPPAALAAWRGPPWLQRARGVSETCGAEGLLEEEEEKKEEKEKEKMENLVFQQRVIIAGKLPQDGRTLYDYIVDAGSSFLGAAGVGLDSELYVAYERLRAEPTTTEPADRRPGTVTGRTRHREGGGEGGA